MNNPLSKPFSTYLDIVRFLAAMLVVLYHSNFNTLTTNQAPFSDYGHSAVIVFFVLSGFVIAFVTDTKERVLSDYSISRMARIYSVAIPVIIITPLLDSWGESMNADFYVDKTTYDLWFIRVISSLFFLNEIWFLSIMSFSNVPYWSLCYEVWYYVLFAIMTFTKGKKRTLLLIGTTLLIGPKILLLFPLWYLGVALYRSSAFNLPAAQGTALWLLSLAAIYFFHSFNLQYYFSDQLKVIIGEYWHHQLTFSKYFISDYILAPLIAANFIGAKSIADRLGPLLEKLRPYIAYISGFTFILYLAHQPMLQFFGALIDGEPENMSFYYQVLFSTVTSIWLLGFITEGQKANWKLIMTTIYKSLQNFYPNKSGKMAK